MATHRTGTLAGVNGVTLFTQTWQPGGATRGALVLIHGFGEHSGRYGYLVDALTAKGYAIYSMDQRGHGQTAGQRGHVMAFDEFTDDVGALIASARGATTEAPLFLFGHSLGGLIALNYAIRRPEGLRGRDCVGATAVTSEVVACAVYCGAYNVEDLAWFCVGYGAQARHDLARRRRGGALSG
ncbi:MAG: alpha/beta fold hydrolase [Anaerolineales bacterium]|nr:alpha/beta fold hydrolase [Anaerolineales bacterium]